MRNLITNRLKSVASMVNDNEVVCDIGTDHGYTAIYIAKDLRAKKIYASDVNQKPLDSALNNIRSFNVEHKVETVLSDGLDFINEKKIHVDIAIISGLGANTILEILEKDSPLIDGYILAPNIGAEKIRKWVKSKKYYIETEKIVEDGMYFYEIIKVNKYAGLRVKSKQDIMFGPYLLRNINRPFVLYWARNDEKNRELYQSIVQHDKSRAKEFKKINKLINKTIGKEIIKYV